MPTATGAVLLRLQRDHGNRYVQQVVERARRTAALPTGPPVQTKLVVGPAGDAHEREADRVAEQVMRLPAGQPRQRGEDEGAGGPAGSPEHGRARGFQATDDVERRVHAARASGQPLPAAVRADLEPALGADLAAVRVHTGDQAVRLSSDLHAQAFTSGADVFFGAGRYAPGTPAGRGLLAHELTHVVQQGSAPPRAGRPDTATPASRTDATTGGGTGSIQRKLSFRDTTWKDAKHAKSSSGGGGGVVFVRDVPGDEPLVVKGGEEAPPEALMAANLHRLNPGGAWRLDAPNVRMVDTQEGKEIKVYVGNLVWGDPKGQRIIKNADKRGTMVYEFAPGEEFKELIRGGGNAPQAHTEGKSFGRRRVQDQSPIRVFLKNPEFVEALGRFTAIDIFTGNRDRLTGLYNAENFKIDNANQTIRLIDNVYTSMSLAFKTLTTSAGHIITSDQSYRDWAAQPWTQKLRAGDFLGVAGDIVETIKQGMAQDLQAGDVATVNKALDKAKTKQWLASGMKLAVAWLGTAYGQGLLDRATAGLEPGDVAEVRASFTKRLRHITGQ
ncbi:MAG TPA: DUF4157 domain-containing protein [Actinomycetes bacterium]|nr:DUF4157 domain-containing protein [Actinomycetes bacterium]